MEHTEHHEPPHSPLIGMYITYLLHSDENPTHPAQQWHGKIKQIFWTYSNTSEMPQRLRCFLADILDEGWIDCDDLVRPCQILELSPCAPIHPRLRL